MEKRVSTKKIPVLDRLHNLVLKIILTDLSGEAYLTQMQLGMPSICTLIIWKRGDVEVP